MDDAAEDMAGFCLATGIPPSEYRNLTIRERNAFIKVHNKRNSK